MSVIERELSRQAEAHEKTTNAVEKLGDMLQDLRGDFKGLTAKAAVYLAILASVAAIVGPLIASKLWGG